MGCCNSGCGCGPKEEKEEMMGCGNQNCGCSDKSKEKNKKKK